MPVEFVTSQGVLEQEVIPDIAKYPILACDLETRGLDARKDEVILVQLGWKDDIWVFDARRLNLEPLFDILSQVSPLFIGHNFIFDMKFLVENYDFRPERAYCTQVANAIIKNGVISHPYVSLRKLVHDHTGVYLNKDLRSSFRYTYGEIAQEQINYAADDVRYIETIFSDQLESMKGDRLIDIAKLEFDVMKVVVDMELAGIKLNVDGWNNLIAIRIQEASDIEMEIVELVKNVVIQDSFLGTPRSSVNPKSNIQMLKQFQKLGFDIENTQEDTLREIEHPLADALLRYRKVSKLLTTYGAKFLEKVEDDGRIRPDFEQMGARSGRFSCNAPNLQNIPDDKEYRSQFVCEEGKMMITADFSQIELKIAAVSSGEKEMLAEYQREDADLHSLTASRVFNVPKNEVTHAQRSKAKGMNFGILYGISEYGMYHQWGIPVEEGKELIIKFHEAYPTLSEFMNKQSLLALKEGCNRTAMGRIRYYDIPSIDSSEYYKKLSAVRRKAGNFPIQGGAADLMKLALVNVYNKLKKFEGAHIINTVHDEMSIVCKEKDLSEVCATSLNAMSAAGEEVFGTELTWDVDVKIGKHWRKA